MGGSAPTPPARGDPLDPQICQTSRIFPLKLHSLQYYFELNPKTLIVEKQINKHNHEPNGSHDVWMRKIALQSLGDFLGDKILANGGIFYIL